MASGLLSDAKGLIPSTPSTLSVGAAIPGDAEAMAVAGVANLLRVIISTWNSPQFLAARERADLQDILNGMDDLLKSAQSGNAAAFEEIDRESSG